MIFQSPVTNHQLPNHVAIIMDGNGRWAKARGLPRTAGHKKGAEALRETLEAARAAGVKYLTVYAFSSENWQRPEEEVTELMGLLKLYLNREINTLHAQGVRLHFIGDRTRLSADIQQMLADAEQKTLNNSALHFTVALSYGARQELVQAVRALAATPSETIDEQAISRALYTATLPDPDLLIRTGGEQRLSNFLLWQCAYTELYFTPVLWPDFGAEALADALTEFSRRERRYGTTHG